MPIAPILNTHPEAHGQQSVGFSLPRLAATRVLERSAPAKSSDELLRIPAGFAFPAVLAIPAIIPFDNFPQTTVPLPSSALMGMLLIGGFAALARFPGHRRNKHRT